MSSKKRKQRTKRKQPPADITPAEDRRADIVTVAWMLTMMATLLAEFCGVAVRPLAGADAAPIAQAFPSLMLFTALVTGGLCLLLTPLVYSLRRRSPPRVITALAITVSLVPFAVVLLG